LLACETMTGEPAQKPNKGGLTARATDFPRWYQEVVAGAELAENGPVRGTMVIRPWGYGIWECLQAALDARIKSAGAENAYFPLFIPDSYLRLEAEHVEGFSPELAVVTQAGGKVLEEPVVVRPTSETVINSYFAKWIQSYRDLPLLINQWANVVRWELRPRLFLRTSEFLWQEGHTAHASMYDARRYALEILHDVYIATMQDTASIPVVTGHKTDRERFAGAIRTWTCEGMMGDGKALQMGTSHELGQNFSRAFGIQFSDEHGEQQYAWQTSWGVSTRLIGAVIMGHGDDFGLRLPPAIAPVEVVVVVVKHDEGVERTARSLVADLERRGRRVRLDDRTDTSFGRRSVGWELKGVPARIEVGPRDLAEGNVTVVSRHDRQKVTAPLGGALDQVISVLDATPGVLRSEAEEMRAEHTHEVATIDEAIEAGRTGFARVPWRLIGHNGEDRLGAEALSVRCLQAAEGGLMDEGEDESTLVAVVGRSY